MLCVGNVTLGGSGKTPVCISIAQHIMSKGLTCCFLTKGYGRKKSGQVFLKKNQTQDSAITGDEPILLSKVCDTFIVDKRNALPSEINSYDYIVCDDGVLDVSIDYNKKILVFSSSYGMGNEMVFPSGPLRISLKHIINDIDLLLIIDDGDENDLATIQNKLLPYGKNITIGKVNIDNQFPGVGNEYLAFSGLANNQKFFDTLNRHGYKVSKTISFPDHFAYKENDIKKIREAAIASSLKLITTEKDAVKINSKDIDVLRISIKLDASEIDKIL